MDFTRITAAPADLYDWSDYAEPMSAKDKQVAGDHYKSMAIQPAQFIHDNGIGYLAGNVIKYVCRYKSKNGKQDLEKAVHYLQLLMESEYPPFNDDDLGDTHL